MHLRTPALQHLYKSSFKILRGELWFILTLTPTVQGQRKCQVENFLNVLETYRRHRKHESKTIIKN